MEQRKVVYLVGPTTDVEHYWEPFEQAEDDLYALGYVPLSPARLPQGMSKEQYNRICITMIDSADAVLFLDGWWTRPGASLEADYCRHTKKRQVILYARDFTGKVLTHETTLALLEQDLTEVFKV